MTENPISELEKIDPRDEDAPQRIAEILTASPEAIAKTREYSLIYKGLKPNEALLQAIYKSKAVIGHSLIAIAGKIIGEIRTKPNIQFKKKREQLERVLKLLLEYWAKNDNNAEIAVLIAWAYLLRSVMFRPRGFTIPHKKLEALRKGLEFANKALENSNKLPEAHKVKAMILLEQDEIKRNELKEIELDEDITNVLKLALDSGCDRFEDKFDIEIGIRYCELVDNSSTRTKYLGKIVSSNVKNIHFEKARAHRLLNDEAKLKDELENTIKSLSFFSNPMWQNVVWFLKILWKNKITCWKELTQKAYQRCETIAKKTKNHYLRMHWSGLRDLYDLAFLAADTPEEKARIADSLKNRPALRYSVWKDEVSDEAEWMAEEASYAEKYIKGLKELSNQKSKQKDEEKDNDKIDFTNIPNNYIAVHFYLYQLEMEKKGYALIYSGENGGWYIREFDYETLFQEYLTWQSNYSRLEMDAASYLESLCECIGETMPFLFELPEDKPIVFIPHDFIRRLPLHAAIQNNNGNKKVFLEEHKSYYLPQWGAVNVKNSTATHDSILLMKYPDKYFNKYFINLIKYWEWNNIQILQDLNNLKSPPEILVILCHGKGDVVNPFNSKLMITDTGVSMHKLLREQKIDLTGTTVYLAACETDLMPPLSSTMDEHLSIATPFLIMGASNVITSLWVVDPRRVDNNFEGNNLFDKFWELQIERISDYKNGGDLDKLYHAATFRMIGLA